MRTIIKRFQHPTLQIFLTPLATIFFGIVVSARDATIIHWGNVGLLYVIAFAAHILNHFLTIKYNRMNREAANAGFWIIIEAILLGASIFFMLRHGWALNILLVLYLLSTHLLYFPHNISLTGYRIFLSSFFQGFILNVIAYSSISTMIPKSILKAFIPLVIIQLIVHYQITHLEKRSQDPNIAPLIGVRRLMVLIGLLLSIGTGVYFSIPTHSFYLLQILFVILSVFVLVPVLIPTDNSRQIQNKINYLNAITAIYSILYTISYLY